MTSVSSVLKDYPFSVAILAGGVAKRLQPISQSIPKALIDVGGEPFLFHQLKLLSQNGIQHVVLCVGHLGDQIIDVAGSEKYGVRISYSFDGNELLGTGGAIGKALPELSDPFFVLYGDSYLECDYRAIGTAFLNSNKRGLMTVLKNEDRWDSSNFDFNEGRIVAYNKSNRNTQMKHIDYGLGVFHKSAFTTITDEIFDLEVLYQRLLAQNELAGYEVFQRFYEIGSPEGLEETRTYLSWRLGG